MSSELLSVFIILLAGLIFSGIFKKLHLPWVVALIIGGIIIGPHGFSFLKTSPVIELIAELGLIFLMFMAGLETRLSSIIEIERDVFKIALINGIIPLIIGVSIGFIFGYSWVAAVLLGAIFVSSSIAVVIPSLEANNIIHTRLGKTIVGAAIIEDVLSLIILSVLLQIINPSTILPLPVFYLLLFLTVIALRVIIPRVSWFIPESRKEKDLFEKDVRIIFTVLLGTVLFFQLMGVHAIIAGFFTGLVLSDTIKSSVLRDKLHAISYGLFIPFFFIVVGANTNITILLSIGSAAVITSVIVIASLSSKFLSGWLSGIASGYNSLKSSLIGVATIPQLSTTLAVTFTAFSLGLLDQSLITAMVMLSIATTLIGPLLIKKLSDLSRE